MMKFLIPIFLFFAIIPAQSQEIDKHYYMLGYQRDYSVPLNYSRDLKSRKMGFSMNGSKKGKIFRFSEVMGFNYRKRRNYRNCQDCPPFYRFTKIPSYYNYKKFYDFKYVKVKVDYYGFEEVEELMQQGFIKQEILKNVSSHQMKSFLAGAYIESGVIKGDTVKIKFYQSVDQKLRLIKDYIEALGGTKFLKVLPKEYESVIQGPTLVFVPNKELLDLFKNEEKRINELSDGIKNK